MHLFVISVPSNLHAKVAIAAVEAGKHVVVEKPMATTLADAAAMASAAERTGRVMTVFHNRRWDKDYQMLRGLVVDIVPQGVGASSGGGNYDVGEELSVFFCDDWRRRWKRDSRRPSAPSAGATSWLLSWPGRAAVVISESP